MKNFRYTLGEAEIPSPNFLYALVVEGKLVFEIAPIGRRPLARVTLTEWFNGTSWVRLGRPMIDHPGYPCLFISSTEPRIVKDAIRGPGLYYELLDTVSETPKSNLVATFKGSTLMKVEYGSKVWEQDMEIGVFVDCDDVSYIQETDVEYNTYMKLLSSNPSQARLLGVEVVE